MGVWEGHWEVASGQDEPGEEAYDDGAEHGQGITSDEGLTDRRDSGEE